MNSKQTLMITMFCMVLFLVLFCEAYRSKDVLVFGWAVVAGIVGIAFISIRVRKI
mgnify:CR=1 FL=1